MKPKNSYTPNSGEATSKIRGGSTRQMKARMYFIAQVLRQILKLSDKDKHAIFFDYIRTNERQALSQAIHGATYHNENRLTSENNQLKQKLHT